MPFSLFLNNVEVIEFYLNSLWPSDSTCLLDTQGQGFNLEATSFSCEPLRLQAKLYVCVCVHSAF